MNKFRIKPLFLSFILLLLLGAGCSIGGGQDAKNNKSISNIPAENQNSDASSDISADNNSDLEKRKVRDTQNIEKFCTSDDIASASFEQDEGRGGMMTMGYNLVLHSNGSRCRISVRKLIILGVTDTDTTYRFTIPNSPKTILLDSNMNATLKMTFMREPAQNNKQPSRCHTISSFTIKYSGHVVLKTNEDLVVCGEKIFIEN